MMKKLAVCVLLSACLVGGQCHGYTAWGGFHGLEATYVPESDEVLAPKPDDYEVVVFVRGDEPDSTYRVIGRVYFDTRTSPGLSTRRNNTDLAVPVLDALKEEARNQGADALVDFNLELGGNYAKGRAKAVVFE